MADKTELEAVLAGLSDDGLRLVLQFVQFLGGIQAKKGYINTTEAQEIWRVAL